MPSAKRNIVPVLLCLGALMGASRAWGEGTQAPKKFRFDPSKLFVNKLAPDFTLPAFGTNKEVSLLDFKGKAILVNFFATWCQPCRKETPVFVKCYQEYAEKDVVMISVDVMEREGTDVMKGLTDYLKEFGVTWPLLVDTEDKEVARLFRVQSLPLNIGIDKTGIVRFYHTGGVDEAWLRKHLEWLLTGVAPAPDQPPVKEDKKDKENKEGNTSVTPGKSEEKIVEPSKREGQEGDQP